MDSHLGQELERVGPRRSSRFLHGTIAESLRHRVAEGSLNAGAKLPALREIAAEFDVSTMTVRRAIRTLEREGYVRRVPAVGAFVRKDVPHAVKGVTFLATDLSSPFEVAVIRGIQKACHERGWQVQIFEEPTGRNRSKGDSQLDAASDSRGAIVLPSCTPENVRRLRELQRANFPFVLVDRPVPGVNADLVESDHEKAAYLATEHLLHNGHSLVALVGMMPVVGSEKARIRGYERALKDGGIDPPPDWKVLVEPRVAAAGHGQHRRCMGVCEATLPFLKRSKPPLAVFAHNACSGWGVYEACREMGLRIPEDVSVVCIDDSDIARAMNPAMAAVAQRTDVIGATAMELLQRRIEASDADTDSRQVFTHVVIDVDLVERPSVAPVTNG